MGLEALRAPDALDRADVDASFCAAFKEANHSRFSATLCARSLYHQDRRCCEHLAALARTAIPQELVGRPVEIWFRMKPAFAPGQLTLHADRGGPIKAKATALMLADPGATKSHSRPYNDNPFSESTSIP
jgi:transposase InsO family protein